MGTQRTLTLCCFCGTTDKWEEDSEGQRVLGLGHGRSNPVRQTMKVKWDGSGLKLSGRALVQAAGVGTFLCPMHLTSGVIRACREGECSSSRLAVVVAARWGLQRVLVLT